MPTTNSSILKLASLIGPVQSTMYGEMFDVKVEKNPSNVTHSSKGIPLHMDFLNYESPPGLQFLHCIEFDDNIIGGESMFLDLFEVTEEFREKHPKYFEGR